MYRKPQSMQENDQGYIYILINPSMEGLVKVGKTIRDPAQRVKELSAATGVPTPFILVYKTACENCSLAEQNIHQELIARGYRNSSNREFFVAPVFEIIEIVLQVTRSFVDNPLIRPKKAMKQEKDDLDNPEPGKDILKLAIEYMNGSGDTIKDPKEAFLLTTRAVKLGNKEAYSLLSKMHCNGYSVKKDIEKGKDVLKQGIHRGLFTCWADMAILYKQSERDYANSEKCWKKFFLSLRDFDLQNSMDRYPYIGRVLTYLISRYDDCEPIEYLDTIRPIRGIIYAYMIAGINICEEDNDLEELKNKKKIYEWFKIAMKEDNENFEFLNS